MVATPPVASSDTRRALIHCPDNSIHLVTPEYGDGRDSFLVNCPALSGSVGPGPLTIALVQLISVIPSPTTWVKQIGGGASIYLASTVDSFGRFGRRSSAREDPGDGQHCLRERRGWRVVRRSHDLQLQRARAGERLEQRRGG